MHRPRAGIALVLGMPLSVISQRHDFVSWFVNASQSTASLSAVIVLIVFVYVIPQVRDVITVGDFYNLSANAQIIYT